MVCAEQGPIRPVAAGKKTDAAYAVTIASTALCRMNRDSAEQKPKWVARKGVLINDVQRQ